MTICSPLLSTLPNANGEWKGIWWFLYCQMPHHGGRHAGPKEAAQQFAQVVAIDFAIGQAFAALAREENEAIGVGGRTQPGLSLSAEFTRNTPIFLTGIQEFNRRHASLYMRKTKRLQLADSLRAIPRRIGHLRQTKQHGQPYGRNSAAA